jgi:hypothetical protein
MFASCVNPYQPKTAVTFRFPRVQFAGRYRNQLTVEDVRQIVAVAQQRAEIKKPVDQIEADIPDHANVRGGQPREIGDVFTTFEVHRQNGRWSIIKGSISTRPVAIITE